MRRLALSLAALAWLAFGLVPAAGAASPWTTVVLIQQAGGAPVTSGRKPNGESPDFKLLPGEVRWLPGPQVEYRIANAPFPAAEQAVVRAEHTLDHYITTRQFHRDDGTRQLNPCTGQPNTITWAPLDVPGGLLAVTTLCMSTARHEIGGFETTFDSLDGWSIGPDGNPATYDVENVATHEWGHIAGLDHVSQPQDACLTMYFMTTPEETEQRTLGWGDKLGLDALYHTGDTRPGPGCGR
jgi:hypothetical protein